MHRISSPNYPLTRLLLPHLSGRLVQLIATTIAAVLIAAGLFLLLIPVFMAAILLTLIHFAPSVVQKNFCPDVWTDEGDFVLNFRGQNIRIPFDGVRKLSWHPSNNPPRVRMSLTCPDRNGDVYTFIPDLKNGREAARKAIEQLNQLVSTNNSRPT
ncbi:MAG: hypothetical protein R3C49_25415 [Planctomycetaceae bacterium]